MKASEKLYSQYEQRKENLSVLDSKRDNFHFTQLRCNKGRSPKKHKQPNPISFDNALQCISALVGNEPVVQPFSNCTFGPSVNFSNVAGPKTLLPNSPGPLLSSDEFSSKNSSDVRSASLNASIDKKVEKTHAMEKSQSATPTKSSPSRSSSTLPSIFSKIDVLYVVNILRHQSQRNPHIRMQDLSLCL